MTDPDSSPKIHIDSDWKAQAQAEKERLAQQSKTEPDAAAGLGAAPGQLPPASVETLISTLVTPALFALGVIPDPRTNQRMANLDLARHHIDLLTVFEEATKGNLSDEQSSMLTGTIYELRSRYIQLSSTPRS